MYITYLESSSIIDFIVSEEDKNLRSPFTKAPTASLVIERDKQAKERAHPPGASKILTKARERAKEQDKKVCYKNFLTPEHSGVKLKELNYFFHAS